MWVLLSSRLRTWVLVAVAVPLTRRVIRTAAARVEHGERAGTAARALHRADSLLARVDRQEKRRARAGRR